MSLSNQEKCFKSYGLFLCLAFFFLWSKGKKTSEDIFFLNTFSGLILLTCAVSHSAKTKDRWLVEYSVRICRPYRGSKLTFWSKAFSTARNSWKKEEVLMNWALNKSLSAGERSWTDCQDRCSLILQNRQNVVADSASFPHFTLPIFFMHQWQNWVQTHCYPVACRASRFVSALVVLQC